MAKPVLEIKDLKVEIDDREILHGLDLTVKGGEIHAIMGPNGSGKSTLASTLMGHPRYVVTGGAAKLDGASLFDLSVDERARRGLFLAMQYPAEVTGVTNFDFLRAAVNAGRTKPQGLIPFKRDLDQAISDLEMSAGLADRYLNEGFSGGEKKRNEILQMKMIRPSIALLDEIDSGLDIDALRIVGENITALMEERAGEMGLLMITHYQRLLNYVKPDYIHVLMNGRIVRTGDAELALRLETDGYDWLREELGISEEDPDRTADREQPDGSLESDLDHLFG